MKPIDSITWRGVVLLKRHDCFERLDSDCLLLHVGDRDSLQSVASLARFDQAWHFMTHAQVGREEPQMSPLHSCSMQQYYRIRFLEIVDGRKRRLLS